jgi:hypothetical protein
MDRREVLGVLGVAAAGLTAGTGADAQPPKAAGHGEHDEHAKMMAKTCSECADECDAGFHHCHMQLATGKKDYAGAEHLCLDTATMCRCAASLCARVSPLMGVCCRACAECCDACIKECERFNDADMRKLIEACRKTAKECRQMAQMMGGR